MKNVSLYIDLAFCLIVLPVMIMIFPVERWFHNFPWYVISVGTWLYLLYFLNRIVTVPCLFRKKGSTITGIILIAVSVAVTYGFSCITLYPPKPNVHDLGIARVFPNIQQYQQAVWSLFMIVETFSFAVGLLTQTNIQRLRRKAVEAEKNKAEIELYKARIKPHFMFNTLNSLYGLFLTGNENALPSLEKFIQLTRYIHTASLHDFVPLAEEADSIEQYVALQSLRLNGKTEIDLDIDVSDESMNVPPMLLMTFVENCFKHGISPVEKSRISILLREKEGRLHFTTSNHIFPVKRIGEHIGIENCRKRLELLYPSRHEIQILNNGTDFKVELYIDL